MGLKNKSKIKKKVKQYGGASRNNALRKQQQNHENYQRFLSSVLPFPNGPLYDIRSRSHSDWDFEENPADGACFYYSALRGINRIIARGKYQYYGKQLDKGYMDEDLLRIGSDKLKKHDWKKGQFGEIYNTSRKKEVIRKIRQELANGPYGTLFTNPPYPGSWNYSNHATNHGAWAEEEHIKAFSNHFNVCISIWRTPENYWSIYIPNSVYPSPEGYGTVISIKYDEILKKHYLYPKDFIVEGTIQKIGYQKKDDSSTFIRAQQGMTRKQLGVPPNYIAVESAGILDHRADKPNERFEQFFEEQKQSISSDIEILKKCSNMIYIYNANRGHFFVIEPKNEKINTYCPLDIAQPSNRARSRSQSPISSFGTSIQPSRQRSKSRSPPLNTYPSSGPGKSKKYLNVPSLPQRPTGLFGSIFSSLPDKSKHLNVPSLPQKPTGLFGSLLPKSSKKKRIKFTIKNKSKNLNTKPQKTTMTISKKKMREEQLKAAEKRRQVSKPSTQEQNNYLFSKMLEQNNTSRTNMDINLARRLQEQYNAESSRIIEKRGKNNYSRMLADEKYARSLA